MIYLILILVGIVLALGGFRLNVAGWEHDSRRSKLVGACIESVGLFMALGTFFFYLSKI